MTHALPVQCVYRSSRVPCHGICQEPDTARWQLPVESLVTARWHKFPLARLLGSSRGSTPLEPETSPSVSNIKHARHERGIEKAKKERKKIRQTLSSLEIRVFQKYSRNSHR